MSRFVELELIHEGYKVEKAFDGREALEKLENNKYDLAILDVMIPKLSGMEVLRRIRKFTDIPTIMLTAKDDTMDKVMGLDLGADDYMTKPFEIEELLARIRVCLKRKTNYNKFKKNAVIKYREVELDSNKYIVKVKENIVDLTNKEFLLFKILLENKEIVLSRDKILDKVWGYDYYGDTNVVDVYIRYLRKKIDQKFDIKLIHTVRGVGYTIKDE